MIRKLLVSIIVLLFGFTATSAQSFHAEISYQSFRPFINFQIELGNYTSYQRSSYDTAYLKGYMDGVNDSYYNGYRFYELVHNIEAYEAGYRDGLRDQRLYYQLRGRQLARRYFSYNDYYSPYYSVQLWLNQLSFTFISAPARRLPRYWSRRVHPRVRQYRYRVHNQKRYHKRFRDRYKRHNKRLKKQARYRQKRYRAKNKTYRKRGRAKLNKSRARQRVQRTAKRSRLHKNSSGRVRSQSKGVIKGHRNLNSRRVHSRSRRSDEVKSSTRDRKIRRPRPSRKERVRSRSKRPKVKAKRSRGSRKVKRSRNGSSKKVKSRSRSNRTRGKVKRSHRRRSKGKSRSRGGGRKRSRVDN